MKFYNSIITLCVLASINSNAATSECLTFKNDPFETGATMPKGEYAGKCLNNSEQRNLNIIEVKENGSQVVANFYHKGKYWKATIPSSNVFKRAVLQVEYFPPEWIAAHTQIRIDLKDGQYINLEGQNESNFNETEKVSSIVFSFEAIKAVDSIGYDLFKGTQDYYGLSVRMFSGLESYRDIVLNQKHRNQQVELNYNSQELSKLVKYYLDRGQKNKDQIEMYHTVYSNCTTEIYEGFEHVRDLPLVQTPVWKRDHVTKRRKIVRYKMVPKSYKAFSFGSFKEVLPVNAKWYADFREITNKEIKPLEEEFQSVEDFEVQ